MALIITVRDSDGAIVSTVNGPTATLPKMPKAEGHTHVEITENADKQKLSRPGRYTYNLATKKLVEKPDTRTVVRFGVSLVQASVGDAPVTVTVTRVRGSASRVRLSVRGSGKAQGVAVDFGGSNQATLSIPTTVPMRVQLQDSEDARVEAPLEIVVEPVNILQLV